MTANYHKTKKRLKVPVVKIGEIESGVMWFVQPEERGPSDLRSWEINFVAEKPNLPAKAYSWLVFPAKQTRAPAITAFRNRMKADPVDASRVVIFEVSGPPLMQPITPAQFAAMFPDDKVFAMKIKRTQEQLASIDQLRAAG